MNYNDEIVSGKGVSLKILSGDTASNTTVRNSARLIVSSGGYVESTTVYNSAVLSNAGIAAVTALSGGTMTLLSGGTANTVAVLRNAKLTVFLGAVATGVQVTSGGITATAKGGDNVTRIEGVNELGNFYLSGGVASNFKLNGTALLTVSGGGIARDTIINSGTTLTVHSGGTATGITQSAGGKLNTYVIGGDRNTLVSGANVSGTFLLSNGVASGFILYEAAAQYVSSGGTALHTLVSGTWAHQHVSSGGLAEATSVCRASMTIHDGGIARNVMVYSGGSMMVNEGGVVSGATATDTGLLLVTTATMGEDESGGVAAVLNNVNILSGGTMQVIKNANFNSSINLAGKAILTDSMTMLDGASLAFDVSTRDGGADAIIDNWAMVSAAPGATYSVSIRVGRSQEFGTYKLAGSASSFNKTVTVKTETGRTLGSITVGGAALDRDGYTYKLSIANSLLSLTIADGSSAVETVAGDLNGDGRADVIMSITQSGHGAEGATGAWLIQDTQTAVWGDLSQRDAGWEIFGTGITAVGKTTNDVYIKSDQNVVGAWVTGNDGKVTGWQTVGSFDANTQVLGLGDFNGDGQTDLLLRNVNGAVGCFFTSGDKTGWNYFQSLGNEWTVTAVGDLNGDGRDDVVLKHDAGFAGSWLTQSDYTMAWANLDTLESGYSIVGCGDFNGDGTSDVLLQNGDYYGAWIVENGSVNSWMGLGDFAGTVEQIGDFDADGIADLRIRTSSGDLGVELVKGADNLQWKYYGSVGAEWSTSLAAI